MKTHSGSSYIDTQVKHKHTAGAFARLRNGAIAVAVGASLLVGSLGFATPADARVPKSMVNADDNARLCADLQDIYDTAKKERDVLTMRKVTADWSKYCRERFGSIAIRLVTISDSVVQAEDIAPPAEDGNDVLIGTAAGRDARTGIR